MQPVQQLAPEEVQEATSASKKIMLKLSPFSIVFKKYKWQISVVLLVLLLFFVIFKQVGFILLLTALGVASRLYERFLRLEWGIELVTMAVVITSMLYGPFLGAFVGIASLTISVIFNHPSEDPKYLPTAYFGLVIGAYVVSIIPSESVFVVGMIGTVVYNLVIDTLAILFGARFYKVLVFAITNIGFNYFVFRTIAPFFIGLMG